MIVVMAVLLLAGASPIVGLVLWVGWGERKLGVSLIGFGLLVAFLWIAIPTLGMMRMMSSMGSDERVLTCWTWTAPTSTGQSRDVPQAWPGTSSCAGTWVGQASDTR